MRSLTPCGTKAAYLRHRRAGEEACGPCLQASAEDYRRRYRAKGYKRTSVYKPNHKVRVCGDCGSDITGQAGGVDTCNLCAQAKRPRRWSISPQRRAAIIERDRGICQLCRLPVDSNDFRLVEGSDGRPFFAVGPLYPTLDHIVPRSVVLDHSMANLRLAHHRCNSKRGVGSDPEQLRMIA